MHKDFGYRKNNIQARKNHQMSVMKSSINNLKRHDMKAAKKKSVLPNVYPYSCIGLL